MSTHTETPVLNQTRFLGGDRTAPAFLAHDADGDLTLWSGYATDEDPMPLCWEHATEPVIWRFLVAQFT